MQRRYSFSTVSTVLGLGLAIATAGAESFATVTGASDTHVTFDAVGPAGFKLQGTTNELSVSEANGNIVVTVPLGNLATGISLRDHHMREKYLEVPKFPNAVLTVARSALKLPASGGQADAEVHGTLTLHGQTHPVTVHYTAKSDGASYSTQGKLHINMNDYGISVPSYLGITVKPDIDVSASFRAAGT